jgi:nucleoside phosphorylase
VRIGPVASGAAVLQNPEIVADVQKQHRKTLGVEMEAYGVFVAAHEAPEPQPRVLAIKSVCDLADEQKSDDFQGYAAYTSARFLRLLVEEYLPF